MKVLILTEAELRQCVSMSQDAMNSVESAFTWIAEDRVEMPPIMHIEIAENKGDMDIKSAYVKGLDSFAVKMGSGFFDNPKIGLPSSNAMVAVFSAKTGQCQSVMLDNGYLTDLRTGLAGAVSARHLAPHHVNTVGILGSGVQARYQLESLALVRQFKRVLVRARDADRVKLYCAEMSEKLGVVVEAAGNLEELAKSSQVIVTTTQSREPLLQSDWIQPGTHITAMGSDLSGKQELDPQILCMADLVVCDKLSQCSTMGELQHVETQTLKSPVVELGEVTAGKQSGRTRREQITVVDLTGTGVQDTAIALAAIHSAETLGLGSLIDS